MGHRSSAGLTRVPVDMNTTERASFRSIGSAEINEVQLAGGVQRNEHHLLVNATEQKTGLVMGLRHQHGTSTAFSSTRNPSVHGTGNASSANSFPVNRMVEESQTVGSVGPPCQPVATAGAPVREFSRRKRPKTQVCVRCGVDHGLVTKEEVPVLFEKSTSSARFSTVARRYSIFSICRSSGCCGVRPFRMLSRGGCSFSSC